MSLSVSALNKSFDSKPVLKNLSFEIPAGSCLGLLGNNGAGKSTLIHTICGIMQADSGDISFDGEKKTAEDINNLRSKMGILPESGIINPDLTGREQLSFTTLLYGLSPEKLREQTETMIEYFFDNPDDLNRRTGTYSTGMRKKLGLIAAFLHKPSLVLLDEPFSGLDPSTSRLVISFLNAYKREDRTLLVSSHNLSYVDQVASHIGVLHKGSFAFWGTRQEFTRDGNAQIEDSLFNLLVPDEKNTERLKELLN